MHRLVIPRQGFGISRQETPKCLVGSEEWPAEHMRLGALRARADAKAVDLAPIKTSLRAIAEGLNAQGIPTSRGDGEWTATQVMRILERLDHFVAEVGGSDSLAA